MKKNIRTLQDNTDDLALLVINYTKLGNFDSVEDVLNTDWYKNEVKKDAECYDASERLVDGMVRSYLVATNWLDGLDEFRD